MNDIFANACYGVRLAEDELAVVEAAVAEVALLEAAKELDDEYEDEDEESDFDMEAAVRRHLAATRPDFLPSLQAKYGCASPAGLHFTGEEDEHAGRGHTEAGVWLLGYGLYAFPGVIVPTEFYRHATWHTWVTG